MNIKRIIFSLALIGLISTWAYAGEGIKAGPSIMHLSLDNESRYDDNIYLEPNGEIGDYINLTHPKAELAVPFGYKKSHLARIKYRGEIAQFAENSRENYFNQDVTGDLNVDFKKTYFKISDRFLDTTTRADTEFTSKVRFKENYTTGVAGWRIDRLTYDFNYTHYLKEYDREIYAYLEYYKDIYTATEFYKLSRNLDALFEYAYCDITYYHDKLRSGHYNQFKVGVKGRFMKYLIGTLKIGYLDRHHRAGKNYTGPVGDAALTAQLTKTMDASLIYQYDVRDSTVVGANYYKMNRVMVKYTQRFSKQLTATTGLVFQEEDYPSDFSTGQIRKKLRNDTIAPNIELQYNFKEWLWANLKYEYRRRLSNNDSQEFYRNQLSLSITAAI